jgi:hypothetical protein
MDQVYDCKFCGHSFAKETTLTKHMCVKKRRYMDIDATGPRFGFRAFQRFFELTTNSKKAKTHQEFIESPYYIDFVKFGNHLALLKPIHADQYIDFVVKGGLKLKDWTKDFVYDVYIQDLIKKEPPTSAADRTITEIMEWCKDNNTQFNEFFIKINPNEAAHLVRTGRISPWVLYLSSTGENLVNRFTEDHANIINEIIDPGYWMKKFKKNNDDVEYIKSILEQAGL